MNPRVRRILLFLASVATSVTILYFGVVRQVQAGVRAQPCTQCPLPATLPEPVGAEGHATLGPAKPGEWRHGFHEAPQSFDDYVGGPVNRKCAHRTTFYLQPLGDAGPRYRKALERMRTYAEAFFGVPARILDPVPMFEKTLDAGRGQYDASAIIVALSDRIPNDALVLMGITEKDLYSKGLNFVFGVGSLHLRCGVYSLRRYETDDEPLFTRRSLKLLSHEAGHILSMDHCVTYACVMQGANHLEEDDRHPMHLCPIDLRKVLWNTGIDRQERYRKLLPLYREWGLASEADWVAARQ